MDQEVEVQESGVEEETYLAYEMHFTSCTFNNCKFYQTGKPTGEDPPPGTGG